MRTRPIMQILIGCTTAAAGTALVAILYDLTSFRFLLLYILFVGLAGYLAGPRAGAAAALASTALVALVMFPPGAEHIQGDRWAIVMGVFALTTTGAGLAFGRLGEIEASRASVSMERSWLAAIVESTDDAVFSKTLDGTILTWNAGAQRLYGYTPAEVIGRPVSMLSPPDRQEETQQILARLRRGETVDRLITHRVKKDGTLLDISLVVSPVRDASGNLVGASTIARNISDRVRLLRDEQAARREAERVVRRIARLHRLTADLSEALTPEQVAQVSLRHVADELSVGAGAFTYLEEAGSLVLLAVTGYSPGIMERWRREPGAIRPLTEAMRTGRTVWISSWAEFLSRYPEAVVPVEPVRQGARVAVPLMLRGRAIGGLYMNFEQERQFDEEELEFLLALGRQCAQALDRARLYARAHEVATTLQRALLPDDLPQVPGMRIHATYQPAAAAAEVGGDWYDVFRLPDGRLVLVIGDAVGHGLEAAVTMGEVRHAIRTAALEGHDPASALALASRVLHLGRRGGGMTTAIVGMLDPLELRFTYAAAGHPAPIVATRERVDALAPGGPPLGFLGDLPAPAQEVRLAPGALLVLYTDGLIEFARDVLGGEAALLAAVREEAAAGSPDPARGILERVIPGGRTRDDIAIVTLALDARPRERLDVTLPAEASSLALARQALRQLAKGIGLDDARTFALQVAVGESVTNVIEHAYGATAGTVRIRTEVDDGVLRVSIEDRGQWRPERVGAQGGRGFALIRALADAVEVDTTPAGTTVRLAFAIAGARATSRPVEGPTSRPPAQAGPAPSPMVTAALDGGGGAAAYDIAQFDTRRVAGLPVVGLKGDLDLTAIGRFVRVMERATAEAVDAVILDLSGASYFDSQGIRALLEMRNRLARSRRVLVLVVPPVSPVRRVIDVSGAGTLFSIFDSVEEAVARRAEVGRTVERGTP